MPDQKLKPGWTWVAFGDVVALSKERSKDPQADGFERYVGLEHLDPENLKIRRWGDTSGGTSFTSVFQAGQVLFGKRRAYQRKVAMSDFSGVCSSDIYVFEPKDRRLLPELLPFICQSDTFFEHALATSAGSLSPRTKWKSLANYEFSLPPLEEQRRIAETLNALFAVENAYHELSLGGGLLLKAATEIMCWETCWPLRAVGSIADCEVGGFIDGDWIETKDQSQEGIRLLQLADIGEGVFLDKSRRYVSMDTFLRLGCTEVFPGDLLIARMADPIGRTCIVPPLGSRCITAVDCCIVRINKTEHYSHYWSFALNSPSWTRQVESAAAGSTRSRISRRNLEAIKVPIPSRENQTAIAAKLSSIAVARSKAEARETAIKNITRDIISYHLGNGGE